MRDQGKGVITGQQPEQPREAPDEAYRKALPAELVSVVGQAAPEIVGMLLKNHPQLATPLMTAINQLRGHGFARQAVAAATQPPLHKPTPRLSPDTSAKCLPNHGQLRLATEGEGKPWPERRGTT